MKKPIFKYGVEIKKPWSSEMYEHNDKVEVRAKNNIEKALRDAYDKIVHSDYDPDVIETFRELGKNITAYGFGDGYDEGDVLEQSLKELENAPKHYLKEAYDCFVYDGAVKKLEPGFIGFETKEELDFLKEHQDSANLVSYLKK